MSLYSLLLVSLWFFFFFSSRRRHTRCSRDWSSDVCSSDLLAGSLQLDRIVEQVVRYAMRFLDAQGALVALAAEGEGGGERPLHVTAAEGTLAGLAGRAIAPTDPGLVVRSLSRERLELVRSSSGEPTRLLGDVAVDSAAAVSLRAHGVVVGTLVIANPRDRTFPPEDMRPLSTVATHAAIVIANARFFQMVRSEEHTSELQSRLHLVCRLLLEKKKKPSSRRAGCRRLRRRAIVEPHN